MKIARIKSGAGISYAEITDKNEARLVKGSIFNETLEFTGEILDAENFDLMTPVQAPQIVAIGLNYRRHAVECKMELPAEPVIFLKGVNSAIGHGDPIVLPYMAPDEVDYEAELVIVIGKTAKNVPENKAGEYILGYTCGNDVSARDCQLRKDKQWARGKSFDTFAPIGPYIVSGINPDNLDISLSLNGEIMQESNTSDLIFSCARLVSYISFNMTLLPGSVIMTGTPSGVGYARKPPVFLRDGDKVSVKIENIGTLCNSVIKERIS